MKGWVRHREKIPPVAGTVSITTRPDDVQTLEAACQFMAGRLQGLEKVASAATAVVYKAIWGDTAVYIKEYLARDALDPVKNLFRPSRARRAFGNGQVCIDAGFHVPRPMALIEVVRSGRVTRNILVMQAVEGAPSIRDWLSGKADPLTCDARRALLCSVGAAVGNWHAAGLFHGDLHPGNLLCQAGRKGRVFYWLDIERTRRHHRLPLTRRVNDLMKLNYEPLPLSLTDRMRVWKAYLAASGWPPAAERDLLCRVIARTQVRWRKRGWL